jgi:hypothetical protein
MNRTFFRFVSVAAMLLAITFVTLPTAEARGLSGSQRAVTHTNDLWSTALSWLANLLPGGNAGQGAGLTHQSSAATTDTTTTTGGYRVNTGSCIDPNGLKCTV